MNITEVKNEGLLREFKAIFAEAEVQKAIKSRLDVLSKSRKLPGFRPGKIPGDLLKKKFGDEAKNQALSHLIDEAATEILNKNKFRLALRPSSQIIKFDEQVLEFHLRCELIPHIDYPDFKGLSYDVFEPEVVDADVQDAIQNLQMQFCSFAEDEGAKAVNKDHVVEADLWFNIPEIENGHADQKNVRFELGRNQVLPEIEKQIIGAKPGEVVEVSTIFPEYSDPKLVGKKVTYKITIHKILKRVPHPINDDLAKRIGIESAAKIEEHVKSILYNDWSEHTFTLSKRSLFDVLDKSLTIDLPPTLLAQEKASIQRGLENENKGQKLSDDEMAQSDKLAVRRVKLGLFLSELSDKEKIDIKPEQVQAELMRRVQANPARAKDTLDYYKNTPGAIEKIRGPLLENAVVQFIISQASHQPKALRKEDINKRMNEIQE